MSKLNITRENFEKEVKNSDRPVLLDFYAPWCIPSKIADNVIENTSNAFNEKIKIGQINIEAEPYLAKQFDIQNTPTFMLVKDGKISKTFVGTRSKEELEQKLL